MKYGSPLSSSTSNNCGDHGFASDQLIRNARIGLYRYGWYREDELFGQGTCDFVLLLLTPTTGNPLVQTYRDREKRIKAIPSSTQIIGLPKQPFIGELSYGCVSNILKQYSKLIFPTERNLAENLEEYLE
ncbi:MAG: hypothetical protein NTW52_19780 [Planctomycetota bacterium]|nr:hypothetical protein [Planctomycetota bacterium]